VTRATAGRAAATAAVVGVLVATSGCSGDAPTADPKSSDASTRAAAQSPTAAPSTARPSQGTTAGVPSPGSMDEPATSSGPLSKASFPKPRELGRGWTYTVDPGDAEEGYAGNGTPALARSPREIVQTAVPFGCSRRAAMPAPEHALEVDYAYRGDKAIAIRGQFADAATARSFFTGRAANLRSCLGRSGSAAIGPLVTGLTAPDSDSLASDRTPRSDPWRELSVLDGDSVVLLAVQGHDPFDTASTRRLVRTFRG
jgi:hypothetical protein